MTSIRKMTHIIFTLIIIISFSACTAPLGSILGGSDLGGDSGTLAPEGNNANEDALDGGDAGDTDADAAPVATLPIPHATAFSPDSEDYIPTTGTVEDFTEGDYVAISATAFSSESASLEKGALEPLSHRAIESGMLRIAHAASEGCEDSDTISYCPINSDGSFECFGKFEDASVSTLYMTVVDETCTTVAETTEVPIQSHMHYLGNEATDITVADGDVYTITDGVTVKLADNDDGNLRTQGDHGAAKTYEEREVAGGRFAFDGVDQDCFIIIGDDIDMTTSHLTELTSCEAKTINNISKIKNVKFNNMVFVGLESEATDEMSLEYYNEGSSKVEDFDHYNNSITFLGSGDLEVQHIKTISFDINDNGVALVLFLDNANNYRLRASNGLAILSGGFRFGGSTSLGTTEEHDFKDLTFIDDEKALLLDAMNNTVWLVRINPDATEEADKITTELTEDIAIPVGTNPESIQVIRDESGNATKAYVLNSDDSTVSVLSLQNSDGSVRHMPKVAATKSLSDIVVGDASLSFTPNAMALQSDSYLLVSDTASKSVIKLSLTEMGETTLADEDYDDDGFVASEDCDDTDAAVGNYRTWYADGDSDDYGDEATTLEQCDQPTGYVAQAGDCDDGEATTNPGASDACGDGKDNDCDGFVDNSDSAIVWYPDFDADGFGDETKDPITQCRQPIAGGIDWVQDDNTDCDDTTASTNPDATDDYGDGIDSNCDGEDGIAGEDYEGGWG